MPPFLAPRLEPTLGCMPTMRSKLRDRARDLRRDSTDAETLLWQQLRNRKLFTRKFRRQHPIGPYIADFCCVEGNLVVELDGSHHRDNHEYDATRTTYLEARGYTVLRFWNSEVLEQIDLVIETIRRALERRRDRGK